VAGFDAVGEFDACYQLWQLVLTVEASPGALRGLDHLEHHDDAGLEGETALGACRPMADGCKSALDRVAGADVLPMFGREVVERCKLTGGALIFVILRDPCKAIPCRHQFDIRDVLRFRGNLSTIVIARPPDGCWFLRRCCSSERSSTRLDRLRRASR
jgi:hypothetical protein